MIGVRLQALGDIGRRYARILQASWEARRGFDPTPRTAQELAFLPAHLELVDTPVSPVPRWSARIIMALFALALLWACFGQLDIVAVAPGKTVTLGRTKTIQPLETAVVRKILVHDGQRVKKGDLLLELDAEGVKSDAGKASEALIDARMIDLRTTALLSSMDRGSPPMVSAAPGLPEQKVHAAQQQAISEFAVFQGQKQELEAEVAQKQAELSTTESAIAPLERIVELSRERFSQYEQLVGKGYVSRQEYLLRQQELVSAQRDADTQRHHRAELVAAIAAAKHQLAATVADTRKQWLDQQRQARAQIGQSKLDLQRASERGAMMQLRAPVDGTVQQLAVHTVGGVVTPAQALMAVVPSGVGFEVEAQVLDQDIGFVKQGQPVTIKLTSFPYTRYGYLTGTIESISHDAAQDDKLGLVFPQESNWTQTPWK
jgi:hemolysin D